MTKEEILRLRTEEKALGARQKEITETLRSAKSSHALVPIYRLVACESTLHEQFSFGRPICTDCGHVAKVESFRLRMVLVTTPEEIAAHEEVWGKPYKELEPIRVSQRMRYVDGKIYAFGGGYFIFERGDYGIEATEEEWREIANHLSIPARLRAFLPKGFAICDAKPMYDPGPCEEDILGK